MSTGKLSAQGHCLQPLPWVISPRTGEQREEKRGPWGAVAPAGPGRRAPRPGLAPAPSLSSMEGSSGWESDGSPDPPRGGLCRTQVCCGCGWCADHTVATAVPEKEGWQPQCYLWSQVEGVSGPGSPTAGGRWDLSLVLSLHTCTPGTTTLIPWGWWQIGPQNMFSASNIVAGQATENVTATPGCVWGASGQAGGSRASAHRMAPVWNEGEAVGQTDTCVLKPDARSPAPPRSYSTAPAPGLPPSSQRPWLPQDPSCPGAWTAPLAPDSSNPRWFALPPPPPPQASSLSFPWSGITQVGHKGQGQEQAVTSMAQ